MDGGTAVETGNFPGLLKVAGEKCFFPFLDFDIKIRDFIHFHGKIADLRSHLISYKGA